MTVLSLELRRVRRQLEEFCQRRNAQAGSAGSGFSCLQGDEDTLMLVYAHSTGRDGDDGQVLLRLVRDDQDWRLYWPGADGQWQEYAPLAGAKDISTVIEQLEQAPLHVHW